VESAGVRRHAAQLQPRAAETGCESLYAHARQLVEERGEIPGLDGEILLDLLRGHGLDTHRLVLDQGRLSGRSYDDGREILIRMRVAGPREDRREHGAQG